MNTLWKWIYIGTFLILLPWAENAFTLPKHVWFIVLTQILFVWWCTQVNLKSTLHSLWKSNVFRSGLLIFAALILSTLFSSHIPDSIWGNFYRHQGLIYSLHLGIFFLITHWLITKRALDVFPTMANTLTIVSILGISQRFLPVEQYADVTNEGIRIFSTLGQANFLGYALAMGLPLFWKLWRDKRYSYTYLTVSIAINLAALLLTLSRSAWIALLGMFVVVGLYYTWLRFRKLFFVGLVTICMALTFLLWVGPQIADTVENPVARRILKITDLSSPTVQSRLIIWQAGIAVWQQSPLLGIGMDTIQNVIPPVISMDILNYEAGSKVPDRFHNVLLDILVTQGLFGVMAWLIFGVFCVMTLFQQKSLIASIALFSGGVYIIALQFGFATITDQLLMITLLAAALPNMYTAKITAHQESKTWRHLQLWGAILICLPVLFLSIQNTYASIMTKTGMAYMDATLLETHIPQSLHPGYMTYFMMETQRKQLQQSFSQQNIDAQTVSQYQQSHDQYFDSCMRQLQQTYLCTFAAARSHDTLGVILNDQMHYKQAEQFYADTLKTNPLFLQVYLEKGLILVKQNKCHDAIPLFETYLKYENFPHPRAQEYLDKCTENKAQ
jgi:O-antigen ligase